MPNEQRIPLSRSLPPMAQRRVLEEIGKRGHGLPGHIVSVIGPIVTVAFDVSGADLPQVAMPLMGPEYVRYPVRANDKGIAFSVPVYLGGISGLGPNALQDVDDLQANLATLVWVPCGNAGWSVVDPHAVTIYGQNGTVLRDTGSATTLTLTPTGVNVQSVSGTITFSAGGHTVTLNSSGLTIDGVVFAAHQHLPGTYVAGSTAVTGDSGAVT